jgi:hypothetical protein
MLIKRKRNKGMEARIKAADDAFAALPQRLLPSG